MLALVALGELAKGCQNVSPIHLSSQTPSVQRPRALDILGPTLENQWIVKVNQESIYPLLPQFGQPPMDIQQEILFDPFRTSP